jgi:hypothetical protein
VSRRPRTTAVLIAVGLLLPIFLWLLASDERAAQLDATRADETSDLSAVPTPAAWMLRSRWVWQSAPPVIALGDTGTATFAFRNIGSTPWIRGTAAEARLGIVDDDRRLYDLGLGADWRAPDRLAAQAEDVVEVGEIATFTFSVHGAVTGLHHLRVRPVVDGVAWMDDEGAYIDVMVSL